LDRALRRVLLWTLGGATEGLGDEEVEADMSREKTAGGKWPLTLEGTLWLCMQEGGYADDSILVGNPDSPFDGVKLAERMQAWAGKRNTMRKHGDLNCGRVKITVESLEAGKETS